MVLSYSFLPHSFNFPDTRIEKGMWIHIPILAVNHSTAIWGDDALEFK